MGEHYGRTPRREHTCQTCRLKFRASRIDARFCHARCRQYWKRHGHPYPGAVPVEPLGPGLFDHIPIPPETPPVQLEPIIEQMIATVIEKVTPPAIAGGATAKKLKKPVAKYPKARKKSQKAVSKKSKIKLKPKKVRKKNGRAM